MVDLTTIIKETADEMETSGEIQAFIKEQVKATIKSTLKNMLGGWETQRLLKEKLEAGFDEMVSSIGIESYGALIAKELEKELLGLGAEASQQIKTTLEAFYGGLQVWKLSVLIEDYINDVRENVIDSGTYSEYEALQNYNDDHGGFYFYYEVENKSGTLTDWDILRVKLDKHGDCEVPEIEFVAHISHSAERDGQGYLTGVKLNGWEVTPYTLPGNLNRTKQRLIRLLTSQKWIVMDYEDTEYDGTGATKFYVDF